MATQSINTTVFASSHPSIVKRINGSSVMSALALFAIGGLTFMSTFAITDRSSALSIGLGVLGITFMTWGVFYFLNKRKEEVYEPTNSAVAKQSFYFNLRDLDELKQFVASGDTVSVSNVNAQQGGNIRMDVLETKDRQFVAVQLLQFVPYTYQPITSTCYYVGDEAERISSFIAQKSK